MDISKILCARSRALLLGAGLALATAAGCASEPEAPETPLQDTEIRVKEPVSGLSDAPPLGVPRPKIAPGGVLPKDQEG